MPRAGPDGAMELVEDRERLRGRADGLAGQDRQQVAVEVRAVEVLPQRVEAAALDVDHAVEHRAVIRRPVVLRRPLAVVLREVLRVEPPQRVDVARVAAAHAREEDRVAAVLREGLRRRHAVRLARVVHEPGGLVGERQAVLAERLRTVQSRSDRGSAALSRSKPRCAALNAPHQRAGRVARGEVSDVAELGRGGVARVVHAEALLLAHGRTASGGRDTAVRLLIRRVTDRVKGATSMRVCAARLPDPQMLSQTKYRSGPHAPLSTRHSSMSSQLCGPCSWLKHAMNTGSPQPPLSTAAQTPAAFAAPSASTSAAQ